MLVAADCTAFAYADFHRRFMDGKTTVIGCPKLDAVDYTGKLAEIFASNDVASVTVARMEVPCCGGLEQAARTALARSGKDAFLGGHDIDARRAALGTADPDRLRVSEGRGLCADAARAALPPSASTFSLPCLRCSLKGRG